MFNYIMSDKKCDVQKSKYCVLTFRKKNIWLGVMTYGPSAARCFFHNPELNIIPTGPTKFGQ